MRIVVTGGSGFIGTHLALALHAAGHELVLLDLEPSPRFREAWRRADVRDPETLRPHLEGATLVVHLAAEHADDVAPASRYAETNVAGLANLLAAMDDSGVRRIVQFSSVSVYGPGEDESTTGPLHPETPYGHSKWQAEQVLETWQALDPARRAARVLRPAVVHGPGHHGNLRRFMQALDRPTAWQIGDGRQVKSICFVGNLVAATMFDLATRPGWTVQNVVDQPDLTVHALARLVRIAQGRDPGRVRVLPSWLAGVAGIVGEGLSLCGITTPVTRRRIRKYLTSTRFVADRLAAAGFIAPFDHETGLARTIAADRFPAP